MYEYRNVGRFDKTYIPISLYSYIPKLRGENYG
jgi:hypothetical protein